MLFLNIHIIRKDNVMREDAVQSLMYAICLGFVVACLQFTMRGGEIDKKREAIIGVIIWAVASAIMFFFFKRLT